VAIIKYDHHRKQNALVQYLLNRDQFWRNYAGVA